MLHRIAANQLNTIAISEDGNMLVWGSNKNYIIGKANRTINYTTPANVKISGHEDKVVCDVSIGEYHAACVVNDRYTNGNFGNYPIR